MSTLRLLSVVILSTLSMAALAGCSNSGDPPAANIKAGGQAASARPKQDNRHPVVQIRTTIGDVLVQLDAEHAPVTVNNFLSYVNTGHYDDTLFHDVEDGFIILAGGYDSSLQEKPAEIAIRNEAHNGLKNIRGTVAMARLPDVIDSSTSTFFVNLADNASLDHKGEEPQDYGYCVFGKVIEGMDVVSRIGKTPTGEVDRFKRMPTERIAIESIRRIR